MRAGAANLAYDDNEVETFQGVAVAVPVQTYVTFINDSGGRVSLAYTSLDVT
jgi:hypothetical protein